MRIEIDEHGYIYVIKPNGEKRYILVDLPNCSHYGKLTLGEPLKEKDCRDCKHFTGKYHLNESDEPCWTCSWRVDKMTEYEPKD